MADTDSSDTFPIVAGGRRVRLTDSHLSALFGAGAALTHLGDLDGEGLFAALETVNVKSGGTLVVDVRVVGPTVQTSSVDLLSADFQRLGLQHHGSRTIDGSTSVTLEGPKGSVVLSEGALPIIRHLRLTPRDAHDLDLAEGSTIDVRVGGERARVFASVPIAVAALEPNARSVFVIDTEDANSVELDARTRAKPIFHDDHSAPD